MKFKYSIVCLLVVALAVFVSGASASEGDIERSKAEKEGVRAGFSPAKLFDFKNYKTVFHKTYSGFLEEMVRAKYFLSRAFRAFVSAIKYKYRKASYYLAVNQRSDWTPEELDISKNKVLAKAHRGKVRKTRSIKEDESDRDHSVDDSSELLPNNVDEFKRELKKIADSAPSGSPGYDELKAVMGETFAEPLTGSQNSNARELPWEKLISTGAGVHLNAETARKVVKRVKGNNPNYVPPELPSFGLHSEQTEVETWVESSFTNDVESNFFGKALTDTFRGLESEDFVEGHKLVAEEAKLPNEVFLDLRNTSCFTIPRDQGRCGSCYAFATISIFEWIYCRKKGKLVEFSEQYMIDCGKKFGKDLRGCDGGFGIEAADFVKNFGVELGEKYRYNRQENECPYDGRTGLKKTGFIRFNFDNLLRVHTTELANYLEHGPMYITLETWSSFYEYGGGVYSEPCVGEALDHAVVLIGHGREDGEEYWIIRNSYGADWGEGGYFRIAKKADCFGDDESFLFATKRGKLQTTIKKNKLHDPRIIGGRRILPPLQDSPQKVNTTDKADITAPMS